MGTLLYELGGRTVVASATRLQRDLQDVTAGFNGRDRDAARPRPKLLMRTTYTKVHTLSVAQGKGKE